MARAGLEWTVQELSDASGINKNTISRFERNEGSNLKTVEAIEKALVKNNLVRSSEFALNSAEWNTKHAWTLLFPTLVFNSRFTRIDQQTFAERDFRRYLPPELANQIPQTVFQESYFTSFDVTAPIFNGSLINNL